MTPIIECIPNFSEGRDPQIIQEIVAAIGAVAGVQVLHVDSGAAANRTVVTFAGTPEAVVEGAFQGIQAASELIDMRTHKGRHPRIGSTDVCPLVPVRGISLAEVDHYAQELGARLGNELGIPVYLYEASAHNGNRRNLAIIRQGQYEYLRRRMAQTEWRPDFGHQFNPKTGATVLGARDFLVAYNVNLATKDVQIARNIAAEIRESGRKIFQKGKWTHQAGRCKHVKAIGWYIDEYERAQVSMNLTNFRAMPMHTVFETCKDIAEEHGVAITGSELIGLLPEAAILAAGAFYQADFGGNPIAAAVKGLGLNDLNDFIIDQRVLEYALDLA